MNRRVLLVEEHEIVAVGLQLALQNRAWHVDTVGGSAAPTVIARTRAFQPSCVLLDIHLGGGVGSGIELIAPIAATGAAVVVLTAERRRSVLAECLEAGAACWVSKSAVFDELHGALRRTAEGEPVIGRADRAALLEELRRERASAARTAQVFAHLSQREQLVLGALVDGLGAEEIAEAHFVALSTIRSQIRSILQKLGVNSQLAAVALASPHRDLLPRQTPVEHTRRRSRGLIGCGPEFRGG